MTTKAGAVREPEAVEQLRKYGDQEVATYIDELAARLAAVEEIHRMQLAAISAAATANTEESAKETAIGRDNPYWTPAYGDVFYAVSREVKERERATLAESALRAARNAARWIPVSERLPDNSDTVICRWMDDDGERLCLDNFIDGGWQEHENSYEHFTSCAPAGSTGPSEQSPYTHWMPLPAAPDPKERA